MSTLLKWLYLGFFLVISYGAEVIITRFEGSWWVKPLTVVLYLAVFVLTAARLKKVVRNLEQRRQ